MGVGGGGLEALRGNGEGLDKVILNSVKKAKINTIKLSVVESTDKDTL